MPANLPGLRERNRRRTHDEILVAVSELLGERDYAQVTIDDITGRAHVSRGTLYSYFPDGREQLVREAYLRAAELVAADGAKRHKLATTTTGRIIAMAEALVRTAVTPAGRFYAMMGSDIVSVINGVSGGTSRSFHERVVVDLRQAIANDELDARAPVEAIAVSITGAMRAIGREAAERPDEADELLAALRWMCDALLTSPTKTIPD